MGINTMNVKILHAELADPQEYVRRRLGLGGSEKMLLVRWQVGVLLHTAPLW